MREAGGYRRQTSRRKGKGFARAARALAPRGQASAAGKGSKETLEGQNDDEAPQWQAVHRSP